MSTQLEKTQSNVPVNSQHRVVAPRVDVFENDSEFLVAADLPGVRADAVQARVDSGSLRVEAMQAMEGAPEGSEPVRFLRTFQVPSTVDPNGVAAELKNGVLWVHLTKSDANKPRRIAVSAG